jgi:predicted dehydrogenase
VTYTGVVIGLGQVGMQYDAGTDAATNILSHSRALSEHPDFSLAGGVDPQAARRSEFESAFGVPAGGSVEAMLRAERPDVVVIATPTPTHADTLAEVLGVHTPRAVLVEKPLSLSRDEAVSMVQACRSADCALFVNYIRRAYPAYQEVRDRISDGTFQGPFKGVVWYSGGVLNNGSHMVNLLEFWFGEALETRVVSPARTRGGDPDPDLWIRFEHCAVHVVATPPSALSYVGAELIGTNGRLVVEGASNGCTWQPVIPNPTFTGHKCLSVTATSIELDWLRSQWLVLDELAEHLRKGRGSLCTGEQALATLNALEPLRSA